MTERDLNKVPWKDQTDEEKAEFIADWRRRNAGFAETLDRRYGVHEEEES